MKLTFKQRCIFLRLELLRLLRRCPQCYKKTTKFDSSGCYEVARQMYVCAEHGLLMNIKDSLIVRYGTNPFPTNGVTWTFRTRLGTLEKPITVMPKEPDDGQKTQT